MGADVGCECVGYQCHDPAGKEVPNPTMNNFVQSVKFTGGIGVVGVFTPQDSGASDDLAKKGQIAFDWDDIVQSVHQVKRTLHWSNRRRRRRQRRSRRGLCATPLRCSARTTHRSSPRSSNA
ncbi:hypothetical protein [Paraburkholderia caledonica]|uniref:hypothetical protein n=1 Tax=Paraburkholderia caledonica TaxID=134536 RepID=UPI00047F7F99